MLIQSVKWEEFEVCHEWCHVNMRKMQQNLKGRKWGDILKKAKYFKF